ncbi:HAD family hydrolase [Natranaerobius thermophilus]|uniref:Haloacid dehalogenase domain protein hydrolase n=1 Tax=Natranaerobius thermophilus (strain ATCC BAA-1301 / DSM 18059 / JW/NM-WN-LF) TaxID=457570 RepID=B2A0G9_NATTJ|nr:HAD family hydrolase [Natranaerobius thermophilus]ACB84530.1 Haloacid dehalogenase domain protein hydrolase [Natranaerobius thermophilus JW/NM-WN-LF]
MGIIWDLDGTLYNFYLPAKISLHVTWEYGWYNDYVKKQECYHFFEQSHGEYVWELRFWEQLYKSTQKNYGQETTINAMADIINKAWYINNNPNSKSNAYELGKLWWKTFFENLSPEPWVLPLLRKLFKHGIPMGLLSNSPREMGKLKLKHLGLEDFFNEENTIWTVDTGYFKPDKYPFLLMSEILNCQTNQVLVVGDNYKTDALGAQNAGMTYFLYKGDNFGELLKRLKAFWR